MAKEYTLDELCAIVADATLSAHVKELAVRMAYTMGQRDQQREIVRSSESRVDEIKARLERSNAA